MVWTGAAPAWSRWAVAVLAAHHAEQPTDHLDLIDRSWDALITEDSPLMRMARAWRMNATEIGTVAICGAAEWDTEARALTAGAGITPELLRNLLGDGALTALANSVLTDGCLVEVDDRGPLGGAAVRLARSVAWMLAGVPTIDEDLPITATLCPTVADHPRRDDHSTIDDDPTVTEVARHRRILIASPDRIRRIQAAAASLDAAAFIFTAPPTSPAGWRALLRQATAGVLGVALDYGTETTPDAEARYWISRGAHLPWAICSPQPLPAPSDEPWAETAVVPVEVTDAEWHAVFPGAAAPRRRPAAGQLHQAALAYQANETPEQTLRRVASRALIRHAERITPTGGWDSLILPPVQAQQLHDLVDRYRYRATVHDRWHIPLFPSPGVVALFAGPSGTGKTTAAQVIAAELGLDIFRVDLSALISKYIGETEKNLEEVFTAAQGGDFLLLFDEADALFGRRSEVSDAHDRYANVETAYLLQRIESFDGFTILTSNFQGNIDDAFLRRIHVSVAFAVPEAADRERIWHRSLADAPHGDLDLWFIAEQFDMSGGSIRLAALSAATLAAAHDGPIEMVDILRAVDSEMTKLRRRTSDHQYGRWRELLAP